MKLKIAGVLIILTLVGAGLALSEDQVTEPQNAATAAPQDNSEASMQWVWGEVTAVDAVGKTLTLKYLDYETDQEKEITIAVDDLATFENVKSLGEIQVKDNLSIDYTPKDGSNIAKSISLEKTESAPVENTAITQPAAATAQPDAAGASQANQ